MPLLPEDCPIFQTCSAAVCPLDPNWRKTAHLPGERVCRYLLATGKKGVEEHYKQDPTYQAVKVTLPLVIDRFHDIGKQVERAAKSGFRTGNPKWKKGGTQQEDTPQGDSESN